MVRANFYLQALLVLVVVTMASPGETTDVVDLGGAGEERPSKHGKPGDPEQIQAILIEAIHQAKLPLSKEQLKQFIEVEAPLAAAAIQKTEVVPGFWNSVVAEVEAKRKEQKNPEEVAPASKALDPTRVYHKILDKMTRAMGWHNTLPEADLAKFMVSAASQLASTEGSTGGASSLIAEEVARMKKKAVKLAEAAKQKEAILQQAQQAEQAELKSKDELAAAGRRKAAAAKVAEEEALEIVKLQNKAKEAAKQYSAQWLKLKETKAEERKVEAEKTACVVRLTKAEKATEKAKQASQEATTAIQVLENQLETARSGQDAASLQVIENSARQAGQTKTAKLKEYEDVKRTTATNKAECEAISVRDADLKARVKQMEIDTKRDEDKKAMLEKQVEARAKEAEAGKATAEASKAGFEKEATKASSMERVISIVSATHYCGMKKDSQTKEWKPMETDYTGSAAEAGNQSDEAKKVCNGKQSCTIQIPKGDDGCPAPGYIARFKCGDADTVSQKTSLIELNEYDDPDKEAESLKSLESELKATPKAQSSEGQLLSKVEALESKPDKKDDTLEAVMKPGSKATMLTAACPKPTMSADVKASLDKESQASKTLEKDEVKAMKAAEKVVEKIEDKVAEKQDKAQVAKQVLAQAEEAEAKAEDTAAKANDQVKDLKSATAVDAGQRKSDNQNEKTAEDNAALKDAVKVEATLEEAAKAKKAAAAAAAATEKEAVQEEKKAEAQIGAAKPNEPSPPVKTAEKMVEIAKENVHAAEEAVETLKKEVKHAQDPQVVLALSSKIDAAVAAVKRAKEAEKRAKTGVEAAQLTAASSTVEAEKEAVSKAKEDDSDAKLKIAVLKAQEASGDSPLSKNEASIQIQAEEAKAAKAEKTLDSDHELKQEIKKEAQDQAAAKALKAVETATRHLQTKEEDLAKLKARVAAANSTEQVVDLTDKLTRVVAEVKEAKEALAKVQKLSSAQLTPGSDSLKAVAAAQAECDRIGAKIAGLKSKISTTQHPESVKAFNEELTAAEAAEKAAFKKLADAKKAQVEYEKSPKVAASETTAKPESPAVSNDPAVQKAREETKIAEIRQAAAADEAAAVLQNQLAETKQRQEAKVKADNNAAKNAEDKAEKATVQIVELEEQARRQAQEASDLRITKKNIIDGRDPHAGIETEQEAALKALGNEPPRSASAVTQAIETLKSATPGSAVCGKGMKCCISSFGDGQCKVQMQSACIVSNATELQPWSTMLIAPLEVGQAGEVSFETRWVKDPAVGIANQGSILRLRVCGKFSRDKTGCFPQDGAGLRFEDFFNSPTGSCTRAKDMYTVSKGALKERIVKHLAVVASQSSPSSKADEDAQKVAKEADTQHKLEGNLKQAFTPVAKNGLNHLVLELLELENGGTVSAKPMMELTGSFSFTKQNV